MIVSSCFLTYIEKYVSSIVCLITPLSKYFTYFKEVTLTGGDNKSIWGKTRVLNVVQSIMEKTRVNVKIRVVGIIKSTQCRLEYHERTEVPVRKH